ncbi:MAG: hypothetical protein ACJ0O0_00690 [Flavobacteriaceae bacterium]|jgi:hypothetical protein|nr:MAG: hypothetical protein DBW76_02670 [Bacteroidota bacterium]|tara:strand:- start:328 stop:630 length:303 start_codon:yes stop_codon:yes gene_type:complete
MITIKFFESSDVDEYINNAKAEVEDLFQMYYPDSECELKVDKEEIQFEIIFKDNWSSPEDIDEDVIRDICQSNELYCWILIDNKMNKGYFYDEDDEFVYR